MNSNGEHTLGDLVTLVRGTTYKGNLVGKPGPALLGLGAIEPGGGFRDADFKTYGGDCPDKLTLVPGDLFAALKGATKDGKMIGSVARVPSQVPIGRLTQDTVKLDFRRRDSATEQYVYWVLRSPQYREYCAGRAMGSAVVALSRDDFLSYPLPALTSERMRVVEVLEGIERRQSILRETNATLEAIAQALFKSWFVDFDPVRAKQQGLAPEGMDEAMAGLFPEGFEDTGLGPVPKGWQSGALASLIRLHKGSINPGNHPEVQFQHFSLPAFDAGQMPVMEHGSAIKSNKTTVPKDAVLLSKLNPHIPRVWLPSAVDEHAVCSTEFLPFVPAGSSTTAFVYCLLAAPTFNTALCQLVTGTSNSHQRVKPEGVLSLPTILPPAEVVAAFDAVASGLLARLKESRQQAQTLATLRDTLLPRLISGQLRQPEAMAMIDEAN